LAFSSNLLGYRAINYWVQNGNDLVIGRFLGTAALGIYSRAYMMLLLPLNEVVRVFGRVMFPILSRMQDDPARVRRSYLRSVSMIALLLFPVMLGLSAVSSDFVLTLYGQVWADVIPILAILSLVAVPQSLIATGGWIFQSQGRADWIFRWGIVSAVATLLSVGVGLWIGSLLAVVASYAIMSGVILVYPAIAIPGRLIDMRFTDVIRAVAGPLTCSVVMAASVWALTIVMPDMWTSWLRLATSVLVGAVLYLGLVHVTRVQAYYEARAIALSLLRGLRASRSAPDVSTSIIAPVPARGKE
jgi:O-antigen/teichoic acid export membrane protein